MKKPTVTDLFDSQILDDEEMAIEAALQRGEYQEISDLEETKNILQ